MRSRLFEGAAIAACAAAVFAGQAPETGAAAPSLELLSSDARLVQTFQWAKKQALAYVFEGDPVGPWYEAALPGREAFCMRDVSHQSAGAHALGLDRQTHNMLRRFAENISDSKDWCSYWEIDRYNRPAPVDYKSDSEFWYNLPANFDVLDACYRMYQWTGDRTYVEDPVFLNFYDHTATDYLDRWELDPARVMKRSRWMNLRGQPDTARKFRFFRGDPSYEENQEPFVLGVDLLGAEYRGLLAHARILEAGGHSERAGESRKKAAQIKRLVNDQWWDAPNRRFYGFLSEDHRLEGRAGALLLYRDVVEDGPKLRGAIDDLTALIKASPEMNVEEWSHLAETLYRYGVTDLAYSRMVELAAPGRERREYPEVAYSIIGAIVMGTMGIHPDTGPTDEAQVQGNFVERVVRTLPELPPGAWAELRNLPVGVNRIAVRHDQGRATTMENQAGPALIWKAMFPGAFQTLLVDGRTERATVGKRYLGRDVSWVETPVGAGVKVRVEVPASDRK